MERGHRTVAHTADVAVELRAPSEETLLIEGARAVIGLLTEDAVLPCDATRELRLESIDPEDRLVRWCNEVLWLATSEGFLTADAVVHLHEGGLHATLQGAANCKGLLRTELKSVTYHDVHLLRDDQGWVYARVVIDV